MNIKFQHTILFLLCCPMLWAQTTFQEFKATKNAKESLRLAERMMNQEDYETAARQFKHTIKIKDNFAVAHRLLGKSSLEIGEYKQAIKALERSFELDDKLSRAALFECGEAYFKLGDPELAMYYYNRYAKMKDNRYTNVKKESGLEVSYDLMLDERKTNCEYIFNLDTTQIYEAPTLMSKAINSKYDEYLPTITSDGNKLVFTRKVKKKNEDIFYSQKKEEEWTNGKAYSSSINTDKNEGMAKFETHGKTFYFAGCLREDTEGGCDIYKATIQNDDDVEVNRLEGKLNSDGWDSQPSVSCDGTKMFFTSSRVDGFGGGDIYMSSLLSNGTWDVAINLGNIINTKGDEEAPFISNDGKTLYFTSTGHPGQGDGDLFVSRYKSGNWTTPINLGPSINSPSKEIGIYVQGNGKTAYFASGRKGGLGGLDIYHTELPKDFQPIPMVHLEGLVTDKETLEPISGTVRISSSDEKFVTQSDEEGWFFLCLPGNKGYSFQIMEDGYEYFIDAQFLDAQDNTSNHQVALQLIPQKGGKKVAVRRGIPIREKRVQFFFEFDSYQLTQKAQVELKELSGLLNRDKGWKVEIVGYADSQGSDSYNKKLSEKRAKSIVTFLGQYGVTIDKVVKAEGAGSIASGYKEDNRQSRRVDVVLRK